MESWKSIDELEKREKILTRLHQEFGAHPSEWKGDRRYFLKLMSSSLALAGLNSCSFKPAGNIIPYVNTPERMIPGTPLYFATSFVHHGYASGICVESHEGRPTKIEGNVNHSASLGAADAFAQASLLSLYDTSRLKDFYFQGEKIEREAFFDNLLKQRKKWQELSGRGVHLLLEPSTSQTQAQLVADLKKQFNQIEVHEFEPFNDDTQRVATKNIYGSEFDLLYNFKNAKVIVSFNFDFFSTGPGRLRYAKEWAERRKVRGEIGATNRLYCVEADYSLTGAVADHRLSLAPSQVPLLVQAVCQRVLDKPSSNIFYNNPWVKNVAADLGANKGQSLVLCGLDQCVEVHQAIHSLNEMLKNRHETVELIAPARRTSHETQKKSLQSLMTSLKEGQVEALLIIGGNPNLYSANPLQLSQAIAQVAFSLHLTSFENKTTSLCSYAVGASHALEAWDDAKAYDGSEGLLQPLILPLYETISDLELLNFLSVGVFKTSHDIVKQFWHTKLKSGAEQKIKSYLKSGSVPNSASKFSKVTARLKLNKILDSILPSREAAEGFEVLVLPDPTIDDGRYVSNAWLQELPKPMSKLTWQNAIFISPASAKKLTVQDGDELKLSRDEHSVVGSAMILPGLAENTIVIHAGYGQKIKNCSFQDSGFNAYTLGVTSGPTSIKKTGGNSDLATTQLDHLVEGRDLVRVTPIGQKIAKMREQDPSLYALPPLKSQSPNAWGMTIDLNTCIGCNACITACQAENNIPVVGRAEILRGREMQWLRVDRYFTGTADHPQVVFQPVPCMQCEKAPCEVVCPVAATVHDDEGLNDMVYNRCVGTRYCSNNCPYKVRRFNFFDYNKSLSDVQKFQKNPDVSVRSRGVMEKCTYCVQRISEGRITAEKENRPIRDGEVKTACQATCPTEAISFGNINDKESIVAKLKAQPQNYALLGELGTKPRTTYLNQYKNPAPEIESS